MSRILSNTDDTELPRIDRERVGEFFAERARRIDRVGPVRAVIYQDKHADLAERRDAAEKACLLPLLNLDGQQRVLDVGCGTGRWTQLLNGLCAHYHGLDFCADLIDYAKAQVGGSDSVRFSVASVDHFSLTSLGEHVAFDRVLCAGVLIYLNDDELVAALRCIAATMAMGARAVFREPLATSRRLTIKDHFSDEMEQTYNAIYRTLDEVRGFIETAMSPTGCRVVGYGNVYSDPSLNNRTETQQQWLIVERRA